MMSVIVPLQREIDRGARQLAQHEMTVSRRSALEPEMIGEALFRMRSPECATWGQAFSREPLDPIDLLGIYRHDHFMGRSVGMVRDQKEMIERG